MTGIAGTFYISMLIFNEFEFFLNPFGNRNRFRDSADHQNRPVGETGRLRLYSALTNLTDLLQGCSNEFAAS
jgi:hypothetical protein